MGCTTCGSTSAITDASAPLINNFAGSNFSGALTTLLSALDQVEMRMRTESAKATWKPSQFPSEAVPYGRKPEGTEVIAIPTPIYFEENNPYVYNLHTPGPEGGICEGVSLCSEPPANKVPGDTWQSFTWRMQGTAWETPIFCLKDLLFYENGVETLRNFLANVERTPMNFYDNFIRNLIWETGEKYLLAATDVGLLWNTPDRVSARQTPNMVDFRTYSPAGSTADAAAPRVVTITMLKYIIQSFLGDDISPLNVAGGRDLMMVGVEADIFSMLFNDDVTGPVQLMQGGMGFNLFDFKVIDQLPFAIKNDDMWFRGDYNDAGEFVKVPSKVYVPQNGGYALRTNQAWLTAKYGILSFMTPRPFKYRQFANLPNMPANIPAESLRYLRPRFQFAPKVESCSYTRGLVQWRAEDEFGFQPTGEKIIHVIYRRDELSAFIREAKVGASPEVITDIRVPIPVTCAVPQVAGCCPTPGIVDGATDYRDTTYTVTYSQGAVDYFGFDVDALPVAAQFQTVKGVFDVQVTAVNSTGTLITFSVDPSQHSGGHFCCTDQLIGFLLTPLVAHCQASVEGFRPDPWDAAQFIAILSTSLDAAETDVIKVFFDNGCGAVGLADATVVAIDAASKRLTVSFTEADFPDGVYCDDAVKVCAYNTVGCDGCIPVLPEACSGDAVTPLDPDDDDHES